LLKNVDIRKLGSGNAGMTNVLRNFGKGYAVLVIVGDALKGVIAVLIGRYIAGNEIGAMCAGFAAIVGHNWPIFFQFKGGKGILTSAVVILMVTPKIGLVVIGISILIMVLTGYVSLGSVIGCILYPVLVIIKNPHDLELIVFAIALGLLAIFRHKGNIKRLMTGTESKFGKK
jgi:glycerol-3-phosphate acyltransferase PlsY